MKKCLLGTLLLGLLLLTMSGCRQSPPDQTDALTSMESDFSDPSAPSTDNPTPQTGSTDTGSAADTTPSVPEASSTAPIVSDDPSADPNLPTETIPILSIQTDKGKEIISNEDYLSVTVSSGNTSDSYTFTDLPASIRCRGNYTYSAVPKKSYRLKFDEKINLFGQDEGKAKNWILLANFTDRSLMRCDAAFTMASVLDGIQEVTSSGYVRLYINNQYKGIYQLCEQHTVSSHRIDIEEQPDVLDSDYFLEMDAYATGTEGVDYIFVERKKFAIKNEQIHPDAAAYLRDYLNQVNEAIRSGDEDTVCELVDIDSFVDMYILQEFVRNVDAGWSSFYMVKEGGGKLRLTWPWDFDLAYGNDVRLGDATFEGLYAGNDEYNSWDNSNPWFYRLMRRQWFVDRVIARWNEIGETMTQAALDRIEQLRSAWESELASNFEVWQILGSDFYPTPDSIARLTDYGSVVDQLEQWIRNRYDWLNGYFQDANRRYETVEG
ncbi:MAG: CotH kinase family protein [Eubacteriales bacterium]